MWEVYKGFVQVGDEAVRLSVEGRRQCSSHGGVQDISNQRGYIVH